MNKALARKLRIRQIIRTLSIKYSNILPYKSAEIYFDTKGNIIEKLNYQRIPNNSIKVSDWKKFIYDTEDNLIKIIDAKNDVEMEVIAEERYQIDMRRFYIDNHTGYIYSIFGNYVNSKRFVELKKNSRLADRHPALRLFNETIDTLNQDSPRIRYSALDNDIIDIKNYEKNNLPPKEVLIIDDANIIEYTYEYIFY